MLRCLLLVGIAVAACGEPQLTTATLSLALDANGGLLVGGAPAVAPCDECSVPLQVVGHPSLQPAVLTGGPIRFGVTLAAGDEVALVWLGPPSSGRPRPVLTCRSIHGELRCVR